MLSLTIDWPVQSSGDVILPVTEAELIGKLPTEMTALVAELTGDMEVLIELRASLCLAAPWAPEARHRPVSFSYRLLLGSSSQIDPHLNPRHSKTLHLCIAVIDGIFVRLSTHDSAPCRATHWQRCSSHWL